MTDSKKLSRNALCPCGSGKKYKVCCLAKDQTEKAAVGAIPAGVADSLTPAVEARAELLNAKAQAYDCLAQIQQWQERLNQTNARIAQLAKDAGLQ